MPTAHIQRLVRPLLIIVPLAFLAAGAGPEESHPPIHVNHPALKQLNWQLGAQGATFRDRTTFEMIDLLLSLDCHHIELAPGQTLSADHADVKVGQQMSAADADALLAKLKAVKLDIVSYGPVELKDEADAKAALDLAKKLKAKNLVVTPSAAVSTEVLDKLAGDTNVKVALLTSDTAANIQQELKDRSPHIGVCLEIDGAKDAATAAAAIKQLGSRVIEVRLSNVGPEVAQVLKQLKDQGWKGVTAVQDNSADASQRLDHFIASVNQYSDLLVDVAGVK
jgi:sugar phosphate isomerase/epimerase